jgi:prefoldin subunit 5
MFDWTINIGNIVQTITMLGGGFYIVLSMRGDIRVLRHDVNYLKQTQTALGEAFRQLGTILTQVAVQDNRISMIEKSVDEMRHGQGFIRTIRTSFAKNQEEN